MTSLEATTPESQGDGRPARRKSPLLGPGEFPLSPSFWRGRRVLVTGGSGFLGSYLVDRLRALGCGSVFVPRSTEYDLTQGEAVRRLYRDARPDIVIHGAAVVGGRGGSPAKAGRVFYVNAMMGIQLIEEARRCGLEKFVQIGTISAYPERTTVPLREEALWNGYPEEADAPYGIAKKALLVQLQAYREQYGFNGIYLLPVNLYGARDDFDLAKGRVIPTLIRKMLEAKELGREEVTIWGTGEISREFLYVDDCARGVLLATEHYDGAGPVNLGSGAEIKIRELAELIAELVEFRGRLVCDPAGPTGRPRRCLDTSKAFEYFGFKSHITLEEGLERTIQWYRGWRGDLPLEEAVVDYERAGRVTGG